MRDHDYRFRLKHFFFLHSLFSSKVLERSEGERGEVDFGKNRRKQQHHQAGVYLILNSEPESGSEVSPLCGLQITALTPKVPTRDGARFILWDYFTVFYRMSGSVDTRHVSRDERGAKVRRWGGIGIASFIIRLPAIPPASVILHDLGGFSLRSKALRDKTLHIQFDSNHLLYSALTLVLPLKPVRLYWYWMYLYYFLFEQQPSALLLFFNTCIFFLFYFRQWRW